jgi:hypothetical protein
MATGIYEFAKKVFLETIKPVAAEGFRLLPDSLLYGTGLLTLITYQTPMLFLFILTFTAFIVSNIIASATTTFFPQEAPPATVSGDCLPGIYTPTGARMTLLSDLACPSGFPSMPMFILSTFTIYCITNILQQNDVLTQLGGDYAAKLPAVCFLSAGLIICLIYYLMSNGCNGFMTLLFSIAAGGLLGGAASGLFSLVFGQEAINILGIPLFVSRDSTGKPLYVCAAKN